MIRRVMMAAAFCVFIAGLAPGTAAAACREDCFTLCCGNARVCTEPEKVRCLSDCSKECEEERMKPAEDKSSANLAAETCKANNRSEVRACNYPKRTVEATRLCLQQARQNFDACMQASGR